MALTENHIKCAGCDNKLVSYTGKSETTVCPDCGTVLLLAMGQSFVSGKVHAPNKLEQPLIALGKEITLRKTTYRVVGFAMFQEKGKPYSWTEHTLYNDTEGFATLSSYDNTFNLVKTIYPEESRVSFREEERVVVYEGRTYRLYNRYGIILRGAMGEFTYNPSRIKNTESREYLSPPQMLIIHEQEEEKHYFISEYVDRKYVQKSVDEYIPPTQFVNPTQTLIAGFRPVTALVVYLIFLVVLVFMAGFQNAFKPEEFVYKENIFLTTDSVTRNTAILTPSFELSGPGSCLTVELDANVSNDWFAMSFELINETTNASIYFENGVEYYSGNTDGESWSEGSRDNTVNITGIRPGRYHIVMHPVFSNTSAPVTANVVFLKNSLFFSNYLIIAFLAGLFPFIYFYREYTFDKKRWYFSDYSQYDYDDE